MNEYVPRRRSPAVPPLTLKRERPDIYNPPGVSSRKQDSFQEPEPEAITRREPVVIDEVELVEARVRLRKWFREDIMRRLHGGVELAPPKKPARGGAFR